MGSARTPRKCSSFGPTQGLGPQNDVKARLPSRVLVVRVQVPSAVQGGLRGEINKKQCRNADFLLDPYDYGEMEPPYHIS